MDQARGDYATVANAIAAFEPVTMIANPGRDAQLARAACTNAVEIATHASERRRSCAKPLHVSVHYNGWADYPKPKGYTPPPPGALEPSVCPPSTSKSTPVIQSASREARNATAVATSTGSGRNSFTRNPARA